MERDNSLLGAVLADFAPLREACCLRLRYPQLRYPKEALGSALGLANGIGQLGAFLSPLVAGYLVQKTATGADYGHVFFMFAGCCVCGAIVSYLLDESKLDVASLVGKRSQAGAAHPAGENREIVK